MLLVALFPRQMFLFWLAVDAALVAIIIAFSRVPPPRRSLFCNYGVHLHVYYSVL